MKLRESGVNAGAKIPFRTRKILDEAVQKGEYISISDFVRDAIKEKLSREGFAMEQRKLTRVHD
jgi:Arc/MetJ-type ribon-helix-helix transcriptional regulator